ncbi:hypothetical protein FRB99_000116 [Tulasnella sp. 403]|nr:hypothetical protein FRB99_000116 [Tulasnella sp. 403]
MFKRARCNRRDIQQLFSEIEDFERSAQEFVSVCGVVDVDTATDVRAQMLRNALESKDNAVAGVRRMLDEIVVKPPLQQVFFSSMHRTAIGKSKHKLNDARSLFDTRKTIVTISTAQSALHPAGPWDTLGIPGMQPLEGDDITLTETIDFPPNNSPFWSDVSYGEVEGRKCLVKLWHYRVGGHEKFKEDMEDLKMAQWEKASLAWAYCDQTGVPFMAFNAETVEELCAELLKLPRHHPWHDCGIQVNPPPPPRDELPWFN